MYLNSISMDHQDWPCNFFSGRILLTSMRLYFQAYNNLDPEPVIKIKLYQIRNTRTNNKDVEGANSKYTALTRLSEFYLMRTLIG